MARSRTPAWMDHLPLVLLGIRTSVRQDLAWCPAELVYGATLRLPGEFLFPPDAGTSMLSQSTDFVARLRASLAAMRPAPSVHHRAGPPSSIPAAFPGPSLTFPTSMSGSTRSSGLSPVLTRDHSWFCKKKQRHLSSPVLESPGLCPLIASSQLMALALLHLLPHLPLSPSRSPLGPHVRCLTFRRPRRPRCRVCRPLQFSQRPSQLRLGLAVFPGRRLAFTKLCLCSDLLDLV